jgi:hypothetical protein
MGSETIRCIDSLVMQLHRFLIEVTSCSVAVELALGGNEDSPKDSTLCARRSSVSAG